MHPVTLALAALVLIGFPILSYLNSRKQKQHSQISQLPGPKQYPIVGRIHDLPIDYMWNKFMEWSGEYGPIYFTSMLGTKFIIVSDEKICEELLVKRAKIYSDRPQVPSLFDSKSTHGSMEYLPLMGKNQYWSRQRKYTHSNLTEASNHRYYGVMDFEVKRWMARLVHDPDAFNFSLEDMAAKVMTTLTWDDPDLSVSCTKSAWGLLTQMSPAGPITNVLTPLWHYLPEPFNPWKAAEHRRHDEQQAYWLNNLESVRRKMELGLARDSFTRRFLETEKSQGLSGDHEASSVIGMMALVGIFTIGGPLNYFLIAMVFHPEWMQKLQAEIDSVCGNRYPTLADSPNLPILRACIKETMRWKPNVPTGVAHEVEADDIYRGYFIEKGTRILPLDIAMLRNPVKFPDPENFRPERWLEPGWPTYQEPLSQFPNIKGMTSFGWGQRSCLGQTLTQDEMMLSCGALAWCFTLTYKKDMQGNDIPIDVFKSNSLLIVKPDPFSMAFVPRSEAKKQEILRLWATAEQKELDQKREFEAKAKLSVHAQQLAEQVTVA